MPSIHLTQNCFYKSALLVPNSSLACFGTFSMKHSLPYNLNQNSLCLLLSLKNQGALMRECSSFPSNFSLDAKTMSSHFFFLVAV